MLFGLRTTQAFFASYFEQSVHQIRAFIALLPPWESDDGEEKR
ncbi:hypothetical protein VVMO6_04268 [Vibrio vulnificus MO6-24/O]|nr:hypothetical protein VVMO6_04268 [Vibrio vulnificus MO6-24/O]